MPTAANELAITDFQRRVLDYAEELNLAMLGGRGGGKSTAMALLALSYSERYRERAKMLFVRQSYAGLRDFEDCTRNLFATAYEGRARYSMNEHCWRLPSGSFFELAQLESHADLQKFLGRSFGMIFFDEIGLFADPTLPELLRSNLRANKNVPTRTIIASNPACVGQGWIFQKYIAGREPWKPFRDEFGAWWVYCPSTLFDNPHLNQDYAATLQSSCRHDPELLKALLDGSFTSATGSFFGNCFDAQRCVVGPFNAGDMPTYNGERWRHWIAIDYGSTAPSCVYLLAESPGAEFRGRFYPRGSIIALDEYAVYRRDNPAVGLNWTAATLGEAIVEWCKAWKVSPSGVADDAIFAKHGHTGGSIAEELARVGVRLEPAQKGDRVSGWERMRRMFADAGTPDRPGLYVSRSCEYLLSTLPFLPRDPKRPDDLASDSADHGVDALRYGLRRQQWPTKINLRAWGS